MGMAKKRKSERPVGPIRRFWRPLRKWLFRALLFVVAFFALWIVAYRWIDPPTTLYMQQESSRLGGIKHEWVDIDDISPVMIRSIVAAEDADFCQHWGIDSGAVRRALEEGALRGGSSISQQTIKNAFLWQGRSWLRKALEAVMTPAAEAVWTKRRMLEIYLNIAEFDTGVFGIQEAARHHYGVEAHELNRVHAGRLAVVLPDPKRRSAVNPSEALRNKSKSVIAGSDMIRRDGRAACFED